MEEKIVEKRDQTAPRQKGYSTESDQKRIEQWRNAQHGANHIFASKDSDITDEDINIILAKSENKVIDNSFVIQGARSGGTVR